MIGRIAKFIDSLRISVRAFEQQINASNGLIRKAITNNTDIQSKWLSMIAENYPQLDMNWLLTGHGSMLRNDQTQTTEQTAQPDLSCGEAAIYYKMYKEEKEENKILIEEIGTLKERLRQLEATSITPESPGNIGNPQKVTMLSVNLSKKEKMSEL